MKKYVYIDDSGDPGMKGSSSENFIIAAVIIDSKDGREKLARAIDNYKRGLGWKEHEELKFHKT